MAESSATSLVDDDPEIAIYLDDAHRDRWPSIKRSKLTKHIGFFRRMFSHDFMETRRNEVTLHEDDRLLSLVYLLECFRRGSMGLIPSKDRKYVGFPLDIEAHGWHYEQIVEVYELLDKYDCEDFKPGCRQMLSRSLRAGLDASWDVDDFITRHYEQVAEENEGEFPERLYPILAEAWRVFATMGRPCPKLTAVIDGNHELTMAIAEIYRAELVRDTADTQPVKD